MAPALNGVLDNVKGLWGRTSVSQRMMIVGLSVAVVVTFFLLIYWLNRPDYKVLYSRLYPEDASTVVKMLQADKVPYQLQDNGATILVSAEKVYDLRLRIAGEGNLHGQGIGFEIFDEVKVGQTDFVQRINYQRALQGELARTISEFPAVDRARVHLVLPAKSLFIEEQAEPSASVVMKMKGGEKLTEEQIQGIVNLVSLSVEGMQPDFVTVSDTKGEILYSPKGLESMDGLSSTQVEKKRGMERSLEGRIEQMLSPLYGPGRVIAKVNAELDFSRKTTRSEEYDPESAVIRSEQRSEETQQGSANIEGGSGEANFRGDGPAGALSNQDATRETRTTNYEINKVEREVISPVGELKRLTVAVIVDGTYVAQAQAEGAEEGAEQQFVFTPRSEAELQRIRQLVSNAVGIDDIRGDTIEVSSMSFGGPEQEIRPDMMQLILEYVHRLGKPFLNGLLIFLFLVMVVRPVVMALIRPKTEVEGVEGIAGLPEGEGRMALMEGDDEDDDALDALRKIDDIRAHALQLSEQNMDGAMAIIKNWLKEEAPA